MQTELKAWEQLGSRYIHRETWFSLRADRVLKGNGQTMDPYYVLEYSHWVNVMPVTTDGKVVLVRQYRYALGRFSLELPGGIMDPHETNPLEAAQRELLEETGYSCGRIVPSGIVAPNPATQNNLLYCYLATDCTRTHALAPDENEELEILTVPVPEVVRMLRNNEIIQSLHVSSMLYGLLKLGAIQL
jgi:8-oxo-dGTP pyrophosphatase MutT (NUDIX family)